MISRWLALAPAALLALACGSGPRREPAPDSAAALADDSLHERIGLFEFAELGGTRVVPVLGFPDTAEMGQVAAFAQAAELLGNAGTLAFVRTSSYAFACGAHGNSWMSFKTMDLPTGVGPAVASPAEARALADAYRGDAVRLFSAADSSGDAPFDVDSVQLTMVQPVFSGPSMGVRLQFTADACYACGDGLWSSYTRSVRLPARELPASLGRYAAIPDAVRSFFRREPPDSGAGWSEVRVEASRRPILAHRFGIALPPAGTAEYLVWWRRDSTVTSAWIRDDPSGAVIYGRTPGIFVVAAGVPWEWREREAVITATPCSMMMQ